VQFEAPYEGQRIMLLALYQKGQIRADVIRLIKAARAEGLYVLAVNTLKLTDPSDYEKMIDCYIERPNFGRDFGSYKTGFLYIFKNNWHDICPRLLLINDSVFFSASRMPKFLNDMMSSNIEVLGSTENYEREFHLGSFCIAIGKSILGNSTFQDYWHKYRLSDIRPSVIKHGEMKLSRTMKRCVSNTSQFRSLYSSSHFLNKLVEDPSLVDFVIQNGRSCELMPWERFSAGRIDESLQERFFVSGKPSEASEGYYIHDRDTLKKYLLRNIKDHDIGQSTLIEDNIVSVLSQDFMVGSQIHQNATPLIYLGLPIVKLDGMYRGLFNIFDIQRMMRLLGPEEGQELQQLLMDRPYGGATLIGWRRAAFNLGMI